MRTKFDEQLEQLNVALITTGALCEDAISTAAKALLENDMELAKKVKPIELEIDQKEREIENALATRPRTLRSCCPTCSRGTSPSARCTSRRWPRPPLRW